MRYNPCINLRKDYAAKLKSLADVRCQKQTQVYQVIFNAPDDVIRERIQRGLSYAIDLAGFDLGVTTTDIPRETFERVKAIASDMGLTVGQLVTIVLAVPDDVLFDYAEDGVARNVERLEQQQKHFQV